MYFFKLKLITQLLIGGLLISSAFLITVGIAYFKLTEIRTTSERISKLRTPTYNASEELKTGVNNVLANLRGYMLLRDDTFKTERLETWGSMRTAQQRLNILSKNWTEPTNNERLIKINSRLNRFKKAQDDIEILTWQEENLPATQLLLSTAIPLADNIYNNTTQLIDSSKTRSRERLWNKVIVTLADFRGTFAISLANIRAFLLSANPQYVETLRINWSKNNTSFQEIKNLEHLQAYFNDHQKFILSQLIKDREAFSLLPNEIIELRERDDWNRANYQLKHIAAPLGEELLSLLSAMSNSQKYLLVNDVNANERKVSALVQLLIWLLLIPILLSIGFFVYVKKNITAPLSQAVDLITDFSEDISHGNIQIKTIKTIQTTNHETFQLISALQLMVSKTEKIINELRSKQKQLIEAKEDAIAANLAKSEFLSHMSHELRTPMNAILGFGQILAMDSEFNNQSQQDNVTEILNAGYHLLELINEMLDLAKIEAGTIEITLKNIPIFSVLNESINMISTIAQDQGIVIINNISDNDYSVRVDPVRVKQIFLNLLSNAVKYNKDQGLIILESKILDSQRLQISFTDTGIGISKEDLLKIFTPFMRLANKDISEGAGIGLAITKQLVEQMSGNISVESTVGKGSTFTIELMLSNKR